MRFRCATCGNKITECTCDKGDMLFPDATSPMPEWFTAGTTTPATFIANVQQGRHPTGLPLLQPNELGKKCGTCSHHVSTGGSRAYHKCDLFKMTHGPGSDIRVGWPACVKWQAASNP